MSGRTLVFGLGRSGLASARALARKGVPTAIWDEKAPADLDASFLEEAEALGCALHLGGARPEWGRFASLVTSPGVPRSHPALDSARAHGVEVISEIELAFRIATAPIAAVTGTNGKSTTTVMAWLALRGAGLDARLCGNIFGSGYPEAPLVEAASDAGPGAVLVAEISSFQLEWVDSFRPRSAVITNVSDDHLNRYRDLADYAAVKRRIFVRMGEGDVAVWRRGDSATEPPEGLARLVFGAPGDDAWVESGRLHLGTASIAIADLPFSGGHNLENAMAALLVARGAAPGADPERLLAGLLEFRGLTHRMERLGEKNGVLLVNNSMCTNPAAVVASSQSLDRAQHLLIGGADKEMDFSVLREYLGRNAHHVYLYGADGPEIGRQLGGGWPVFTTMREAFEAAVSAARPGEAVMLAPGAASLDQFRDFRDRGNAFSRLAREWLA